jgi:hypothetical protein
MMGAALEAFVITLWHRGNRIQENDFRCSSKPQEVARTATPLTTFLATFHQTHCNAKAVFNDGQ